MFVRKCLLATVSLVCVCSVSFGDDFVLDHLQGDSSFISASYPASRASVSSLPGEVFGQSSDEVMASVDSVEAEENAIQRANALVLMGLGGALLAAVSATVLFFAWRKKSQLKAASAGMQLVGI